MKIRMMKRMNLKNELAQQTDRLAFCVDGVIPLGAVFSVPLQRHAGAVEMCIRDRINAYLRSTNISFLIIYPKTIAYY